MNLKPFFRFQIKLIAYSRVDPEVIAKKEVTQYSTEFQNWSLTTGCKWVPYPGYPFGFYLSAESPVAWCCILICRYMQKHIQHNKDERTQFFRKIYLSLYWEGCVWEGVEDRTKTATYWSPNSIGYYSLSFSFSWAAQTGAWGPSLCWDMVLIPASSLQLIWTSCHRGNIIIWRPPTSCERQNSHSILPLDSQGRLWSPDIFDRMHLLFPQVHFFFLTAWPGRGSICNTGVV